MQQRLINAKVLNDRIRHLEERMKTSPSKSTLTALENLRRMKAGQTIIIFDPQSDYRTLLEEISEPINE